MLAGCGRVGFDATDAHDGSVGPDVLLAGHDEDLDGLDDNLDPCPHIAGTADDDDGDGVGNACDPSTGMEKIALFDAFTTLDPSLTLDRQWQLGDDELVLDDTGFRTVNRGFAITDANIWIGITIRTLATPDDHQIIIHPSAGTEQPRYFGQVYRTPTINEQGIVRYDDVSFMTIDSAPLGATGIPLGDVTLHLAVTPGADTVWTTSWGDASHTSSGPTPAYTGSSRVRFVMSGMTGAIRYTCIITRR